MSSFSLSSIPAVDYVLVGHVSLDILPSGPRFGGTALYSALAARAHGMRVGILTSFAGEQPREFRDGFHVINIPASNNTVFENNYISGSRTQRLLSVAEPLSLSALPDLWRKASIIHLAPIANEINIEGLTDCKPELMTATPQGWFRDWDEGGTVRLLDRSGDYQPVLERAICVFSDEDLAHNEETVERLSHKSRMLVITEGKHGSRVYWNGDVRRFPARKVEEIDPTGAGDIFATSFFCRLLVTRDPWEATRYANEVAAYSVTRIGLTGIPTPEEIRLSQIEILH